MTERIAVARRRAQDYDSISLRGEQGPRGLNERNTRALSLLRIAVGILFLVFGEYKVFGTQFTLGGGFQGWIERFLSGGAAYPFMVPVLRNVVLPHQIAIAFLVAYGELAIGVALVLGVLVRTASVAGVIYMLALLFSSNYPGPHVAPWQYFGAALDHLVLAMCFATFAVGEPGAWSLGAAIRNSRFRPLDRR
ncbi:MAG TPA: DoxX family protein [Gemmatimonadaceae bacterium]|jgi:thiosulfate dehydrogenase [quinone] large subunit